jgi:hypothetical protein
VALACQREAPTEHAVALSALVHALKQQNKAAGEAIMLQDYILSNARLTLSDEHTSTTNRIGCLTFGSVSVSQCMLS